MSVKESGLFAAMRGMRVRIVSGPGRHGLRGWTCPCPSRDGNRAGRGRVNAHITPLASKPPYQIQRIGANSACQATSTSCGTIYNAHNGTGKITSDTTGHVESRGAAIQRPATRDASYLPDAFPFLGRVTPTQNSGRGLCE